MKISKLVLAISIVGSVSVFGANAATARHYDLNNSELMRTTVNMTSTPALGTPAYTMFVTGQHGDHVSSKSNSSAPHNFGPHNFGHHNHRGGYHAHHGHHGFGGGFGGSHNGRGMGGMSGKGGNQGHGGHGNNGPRK